MVLQVRCKNSTVRVMKNGDLIKRLRQPVDDPRVPVTATMRKSDKERIEKAAVKAGVPVGPFIGELAVERFDANDP